MVSMVYDELDRDQDAAPHAPTEDRGSMGEPDSDGADINGNDGDTSDASSASSSDSSPGRKQVVEIFHAQDDATTVGRVCFWFGAAGALGAACWMELVMRDLGHNSPEMHACLPRKAKATLKYVARPGGYLSMFNGLGCIVLFYLCWALVLYACHACDIDYLAVMKRSPLVSTSKADTLIGASKLVLIWVICRMVFVQVGMCNPGLVFLQPVVVYIPALMYVSAIVFMIYWTRSAVPRLLTGAVTSLVTAAGVTPIDGFVGNWLCSLAKPFVEVAYTTCFYVSGEALPGREWGRCYAWMHGHGVNAGLVILLLPNFLRFAQNMRQFYDSAKLHPSMTNALKYFLSMMVTLFSTLHLNDDKKLAIWLSLAFFNMVYSFAWDVVMDWGLIEARSAFLCLPCGKVRLRRNGLLGTGVGPYVFAILADFFARIMFVYTLVPASSLAFASAQHRILTFCFFFAPGIEVLRRAMWSVLSFEYKWLDQLHKGLARPAAPENKSAGVVASRHVQSRYFKAELAVAVCIMIAAPAVIVFTRSM